MYLTKHCTPSSPDQPFAVSQKRKREKSLELDLPSAKKGVRPDITGNLEDDQAEATRRQLLLALCESSDTSCPDQAPLDPDENTEHSAQVGDSEEKTPRSASFATAKGHSQLEKEWGHIMSTATAISKRSGSETSSKPVSTTSRPFRQQLRLNNVLEAESSSVPANLEQIQAILDGSRQSTSPGEEDFLDYKDDVTNAVNEKTLQIEAWTAVCKRMRSSVTHGKRPQYSSVCDLPFNKVPKDVGFNHGISPPQPDLALGFRWYDFGSSTKLCHIAGVIPPHDDHHTIALPHLFGEYKKPGGAYQEAAAQAAYDGAYGTWARSEVLKVIGDVDDERMAYVFSFATDGMTMRFFAHFRDVSDQICYHQHEIFPATSLIQTVDAHRLMYRRMRNLQELAFKNADSLRQRIAQWQTLQLPPPPIPNTRLAPRGVSSLHGCNEAAGVTLPSPATSTKRAASAQGPNAPTQSQKRPTRENDNC